jgi:hypothetical protein
VKGPRTPTPIHDDRSSGPRILDDHPGTVAPTGPAPALAPIATAVDERITDPAGVSLTGASG